MTKIIPFPPSVRLPVLPAKSTFAGYPRFAKEFGHTGLKLPLTGWHAGPANDHDVPAK